MTCSHPSAQLKAASPSSVEKAFDAKVGNLYALGAGLGTVLHGPLIGVFPLLRALLAKGAKLGVVVAIVSTWAIKLPMIPLEIRLFGWKFALMRNALLFVSAFVMAPLMELALGEGWVERFRGPNEEE